MFIIKPFDNEYHHDLLFCYLLAKDAIGGNIKIRDDLFDLKSIILIKERCFG